MFSKILIANRGEIACRVMRTARALGVKTVAVYSDADRAALHVEMADEAVHIGPAPVSDSYLQGTRIIDAALQTGAQAIHPGYGFLSENPDFVDAVTDAGLVFIGPSADAIRAMGLKDAAKALMEQAGVPVVPGYHGNNQDPAFLAQQADDIGYPVLIKARAGGGGKGMRLVEDPKDFAASLESAAREGKSAFGDAAVLVEKFITAPRHIEVQVFGDSHGNVVHLFERDCSLQRRHQKVIEEAPAPGMTPDMRAAMTDAAVKAAQAIDYQSAGTIEFIVDGSGALSPDKFWFMEMNTRLQVEHPVTEAITGTDLVAWQLLVAAGEPLPLKQGDIHLNGHAFEARLYAEDPGQGFLPATGQIDHISYGAARVDTGVRAGDAISQFYDPMISKLITHGPTRSAALGALRNALSDTHVAGLTTNVGFLGALARHDGFAKGDVDTGLIARDLDALTVQPAARASVIAIAGLALSGIDFATPRVGWRQWDIASHTMTILHDDTPISLQIALPSPGSISVTLPDEAIALHNLKWRGAQMSADIDGHRLTASVALSAKPGLDVVSVLLDGVSSVFQRPDPLSLDVAMQGSGDDVVAPMTGAVRSVAAHAGQTVSQGDAVIVLEAMKMEHTLVAPRDGVIAEVMCAVGDQVSDGSILLRLDAGDADA